MSGSGRSIVAGYEWRQRFTSQFVLCPEGSTFRAQVRSSVGSDEVLTELSTAENTIQRVDDFTLDVIIPGSASAQWTVRRVVFDVVRTDTDPDQHLGFQVEVSVAQPVTRL